MGRKSRGLDSMTGDSWDRSNHRKTLWTGAWEIGVKCGVPFPAVVFEWRSHFKSNIVSSNANRIYLEEHMDSRFSHLFSLQCMHLVTKALRI